MNIYAVDEHLKYFQFLAIYKQRCPENFPTGFGDIFIQFYSTQT